VYSIKVYIISINDKKKKIQIPSFFLYMARGFSQFDLFFLWSDI
jgi:hypothetical protein